MMKRSSLYLSKQSLNSLNFSSQIPKNELDSIQCHFNWDIVSLKEKSHGYFVDRIAVFDGHINGGETRNLAQIYAAKAFFTYMYYLEKRKANPEDHTNEENKQNAIESLACALEESIAGDNCIGYQLVIYGNLVFLYNDMKNDEKALENLECYNDLIKQFSDTAATHPEVLAMKGFAFSHAMKYEDAIDCYSEALQNDIRQNNPEWLIGLGFAKQWLSTGRRRLNEDAKEIEMLYRHAIQIDDSYDYAKLKLARILWDTQNINGIDEVEYLIEQASANPMKNVVVIEETAAVLNLTCRSKPENYQKVFDLYRESEKIRDDSPKTLRGLARYYQRQSEIKMKTRGPKNKGRNKRGNHVIDDDLNAAIRYLEKLTNGNNGRFYDKIDLAELYYKLYTKECNQLTYKTKSENLYLQVLSGAETETVSGKIQIWYKYSRHRKLCEDKEGEIEYLKKVIGLACEAKEDMHGYVREVEFAEHRLLELASKPKNLRNGEIEALELKSLVFEKWEQFDSAIFYLEKALQILQIKDNVGIQLKLAKLYVKLSIARKENKAIASSRYSAKAFKKIDELPRNHVKWELYKVMNKVEFEELTKSEPNLMELQRLRLDFENVEFDRQVRGTGARTGRDEFIRIVMDVIGESKRVLDSSINHVKEKVYYKSSKDPPFCYYPAPTNLQKRFPKSLPERQMEQLFENVYKLPGIKTKIPGLLAYLVGKQPTMNPDYSWLQEIIDIRNTNEHEGLCVSRESLEISFPDDQGKADIVRKMSKYAAEVRLFVGARVKEVVNNTTKHTSV
jgi:hypothetical protein